MQQALEQVRTYQLHHLRAVVHRVESLADHCVLKTFQVRAKHGPHTFYRKKGNSDVLSDICQS